MRNPESASTTRENLHLQADKESVYFWREIDYSERGNKKLKPEFSRIRGGGSMSEISICSIDFDKSSTENGILQDQEVPKSQLKPPNQNIGKVNWKKFCSNEVREYELIWLHLTQRNPLKPL